MTAKLHTYQSSCYEAFRDKLLFLFKFYNIPSSDRDIQLSVAPSLSVVGWTWSSPPHILVADPHVVQTPLWWSLAGITLLPIHL